MYVLIKRGKRQWVEEENYRFSNMSMATSLGQGRETKKESVGAASILLRTVLARLDFWHNTCYVSRKRIVVQTVLILQSSSLGVSV